MAASVVLVREEPLYEVVNGERVEVPRMGAFASTVASMLATSLNLFAIPRRLGFAVTETLFVLRPDRPQRRPDVAFISFSRWPDGEITEDPPAYEVVPSIAVEVVSPTNSAIEIEEKVHEYFQAGVELVWTISPTARRVHVYDASGRSRVVRLDGELDGGTALPEFRLKLADLFTPLVKPESLRG